jgi:serine/threonine-protein kinase
MSIGPGTRIGPYEVKTLIGGGGMGQVWRAHHAALKRDDALKVLPDAFAADPERVARFQREAQLLAALNHPNIAHIHGLEQLPPAGSGQAPALALVMELVEGPTLADVIAGRGGPSGPAGLPLDEVLPLARQIADALEAAHEQGIVHRDLKPANIKVRDDGTVKVLDFGLAKLTDTGGAGATVQAGLSQSPTITTPAMTRAGMLLGTAAYMSPEQARGRPADRRSDIWAFGCVLYEMLTGRRAFEGEDLSETLANVLKSEPDWDALDVSVPSRLRVVLQRCLQKDPRQRLHDMADVKLAMAGAFETPIAGVDGAASGTAPRRAVWRVASIAGVLGVLIGGVAVGTAAWLRRADPPPPVSRLTVIPEEGRPLRLANNASSDVAISPDGRRIVYAVGGDGGGLVVRPVDQLQGTALSAIDYGVYDPFFSPDGAWVGFYDPSDRTVKKMLVQGGPASKIASLSQGFRGASWGDDGTIVFATSESATGLMKVSAAGGEPELLTTPDTKSGEVDHIQPQLLPGGRAALFAIQRAAGQPSQIALLDLATGTHRVVIPGGSHAQYVTSGHVVFATAGTLRAARFDLAQLSVVGAPVPVVENVLTKPNGVAAFSVAENGSLVYLTQTSGAERGAPVWVGRDGRELAPLVQGQLDEPQNPRLSPDGTRLALVVAGDVWAFDVGGRPPVKLTFTGGAYSPTWTRDGKRLVYEAQTPQGLLSIPADGSGGMPEPASPTGHFHPHGFSNDGRDLLAASLNSSPATGDDIVRLPVDKPDAPQPLVQTPAAEGFYGVALSPDGRWLAYASTQTGRLEIWVRPYDGPGAPVRVSPNTGIEPIWSSRGSELYYLEGNNVMAVAVGTGETFTFKPPVRLFEHHYRTAGQGQPPTYDVAADGRFLMIKPDDSRSRVPSQIVVVLNWAEELKRLVPAQ